MHKEFLEVDGLDSGADLWNQIYDRYHKYVYKCARQECFRPDDVDDVVQTVWELLWAKRDTFGALSTCKQIAYITVTVKNVVRMNARKKKLTYCSLDTIAELGYDGSAILEYNMDRKIRIEKFRKIWSKVDPAIREILERKYVLGQTDIEIANSMKVKPTSIRMYLTRARRIALATLHNDIDQI